MQPSRDDDRGWWTHAFGHLYLTVYGHRDDADARARTPGLLRLLQPRPNARVLDVACGEGRYARALSRAGLRVTGVDLSPELIEAAVTASADLPGAPAFLVWDARTLPFDAQFEGAVSLFTSFGYFDDRFDDLRLFQGVRRALVPGGRFVLDYLNARSVRKTLVPASEVVRGHHRLTIRRRIDDHGPGGPVVRKTIEVQDDRTGGHVATVSERVRLYDPDEIDALLVEAKLEPKGDRRGDLDGRRYDDDAPRYVRAAVRSRA